MSTDYSTWSDALHKQHKHECRAPYCKEYECDSGAHICEHTVPNKSDACGEGCIIWDPDGLTGGSAVFEARDTQTGHITGVYSGESLCHPCAAYQRSQEPGIFDQVRKTLSDT